MNEVILEKLKEPQIECDRIRLRHFEAGDDRLFFPLLSDRDSCYYDGGYEPFEHFDEQYRDTFRQLFIGDAARFCIVDRENGEPVGLIHVMDAEDEDTQSLELGFEVIPDKRGKGYAFEAVGLMTEFLLDRCGVERLLVGTMERNRNCLKLIEKLGFEPLERRAGAGWDAWNKCPCDLLYFSRERGRYSIYN